MKNVIYYKSNTGFTKKYVDMLSNRIIPLEVFKIEEIKKKNYQDADNIFYGGPLKSNVILGLKKFLKHYKNMKDKNIFIFAVGIQPIDQDKRDLVITANALDEYHVRLYLLPGGMDISKMKFPVKQLTKLALNVQAKRDPSMAAMIESRLKYPVDMTSNMALDTMVEKYRAVSLRK